MANHDSTLTNKHLPAPPLKHKNQPPQAHRPATYPAIPCSCARIPSQQPSGSEVLLYISMNVALGHAVTDMLCGTTPGVKRAQALNA